MTTLVLGLVAIANLFSKQIATIYGVAFTVSLFVLFTISEQINTARSSCTHEKKALEEFNLDHQPQIDTDEAARPARLRAGRRARLAPTWSICGRCCRRPICAGTTSW